MSLAAPLAIGVTSDAEMMDIFIDRNITPQNFQMAVNRELPEGFSVLQAHTVGLLLPSLAAQVRFAEYRVEVESGKSPADIQTAIADLIGRTTFPWQHQRDTGAHHYDLRPLIDTITLDGGVPPLHILNMRLRCDGTGSGRPEQVTLALGLPAPVTMHRTRLVLEVA